jgi:TolA-binding protein
MLPHRKRLNEGRVTYERALRRFEQHRYDEAEKLLRQSAQEQKKKLGAEHVDTLLSKHWLARALSKQEKYPEAEQLFRQSVQQNEKVLGVEHEDTLGSKYWLAMTLYDQEKYPEAEQLLRQLVQLREKVLCVEHEVTLSSKYWLAMTLSKQKKYPEAEQLLRQSVQQRGKVLGVEHEDTLSSKYWLAMTLSKQKKYPEAEQLLRQSVQQNEKVLGVEHEDTLSSKHRLAITLHKQEKYPEAEQLLRQSVQQRGKVLGVEHKDTLLSKYRLAITLSKQEKYPEAEQLFRQSVQQRGKVLGVEHKDTLLSKYWLAMTLSKQEKYPEAEQLLRQSVQQRGKVLGVEHEDTLLSKYWLAITLYDQEKYPEAEQLLRQSVQQRGKVLGVEHKDTLSSKYWLAITLYDQEKYPEAEQLLRQSILQREKVLGAEHEDTFQSKRLLGEVLRAMAPAASTDAASERVISRLSDFFIQSNEDRPQYSDFEISQISSLLTQLDPRWSKIPRTYIILRTIGCLSFIESFLDLGFSDYWFPVTERSVPHSLHPTQRLKFVDAQDLVITKSLDVEKGQHRHFRQAEPLPFEEKGILGAGGFGQVDKVLSLISYQEYARKRVPRSTMFSNRRTEGVKQFIAEIEILKRVKHRHVVDFIGSYTDPKYMALLMSPVADMDLSTYLVRADSTRHGELRTFFGCLARAIEFLHEQNVRHKDIKPANILIHNGNVLVTDFGLSFDFTDAEGSTTVSMINGMTPRYCAPEVAMHEPRNTSSDIWSLGAVFLEMVAVLKGRTVEYVYDFFKEHGMRLSNVRTNPTGFRELVTELKETATRSDNIALVWVQDMLVVQPRLRLTAASLVESITTAGQDGEGRRAFCGICCVSSDDEFSDPFDELDEFGR